MSVDTRHVKYAFADVVRFTENRTVEAQVEIIAALNEAFRDAVGELEVIYLPTGDGICAGVIQPGAPADSHLKIALRVLELVRSWSEGVSSNRRCTIRFGINESVDSIVTDINGQRNVAGAGVNHAQRLMSLADGNQIVAGVNAYQTLRVRDEYIDAFRPFRAETKHGQVITAYQLVKPNLAYLNIGEPSIVRASDPIDLDLMESLSKKESFSTGGQVSGTFEAITRWDDELKLTLGELYERCNSVQTEALNDSQNCWENYRKAEINFLGRLRETVQGTIFRVLGAAIRLELVTQRVKALREYRDTWFDGV